ncbi:MAG: ABC transporter ATP-binding protein/permease [Candidatus Ancillula sp.]|jgi:ATP-binding cassette subfamily B protein|nr:ABC transporter ATP-binding protein/permease [Candidatus Ancillula sp.]
MTDKNTKTPKVDAQQAAKMGAKPKEMRKSLGRIVKMVFNDKPRVFMMFFGMLSAAILSSLGPRVLGSATNVLFNGLVSKQVTSVIEANLPAGASLEMVKTAVNNSDGTLNIDKLQSFSGQDFGGMKDMLSSMTIRLGEGVDFTLFGEFLLMIIGIYLLQFVFRWVSGWCSVRLVSNMGKNLRQQIEEKLWRMPLSYYDKTSRGEIMSRTTNDLDNLTQAINQTGGDLIFMTMMVTFVVIMMFLTSWVLALIALLTIPVAFIVIGIVMSKSQPQFRKQWSVTGRLNGHIEEAYTGHSLIKAYGKKADYEAEFNADNEELFKAGFKAQFISGTIMPIMTFMTNINYVLVALIGGLRVASGSMSLGDVQAFIQYSRQFSQPLGQISQMMNMLQSGAASAERIFEILDAPEEDQQEGLTLDKQEIRGEIEFKHVNFSYDPERPLIQDMNLLATPGKTVAIVGPTGAGKTTLVNLIMRFYDIDSGVIELDGVSTREMSRSSLRKNVGMVLQDSWLFKGSIRENLEYGLPEGKVITEEQFLEATRATYVDHFVRSLPDGYQTILDDDGDTVSVGEKQLLTIARAFLADPDILILDEATSSVDTRTEVLVQKAMNKLRSNRTSFVIAHRLSTIRDADTIVVMDKGSIKEMGSHDELIARGGFYADLYQSQFEKEDEE